MPVRTLDRIAIQGYKSIASCDVSLKQLNVLVGPNGAGKSNFISALGLLGTIINGDLQLAIGKAGGVSTLLHGGPTISSEISLQADFGLNSYKAVLVPDVSDAVVFESEICYFHTGRERPYNERLGSGHRESRLAPNAQPVVTSNVAAHCRFAMTQWRVFHFHDTSDHAPSKQKQAIDDNAELRTDGGNIAAFLYRLQKSHPLNYRWIVDSIRLVAPFFQDFRLAPDRINPNRIQLEWRQVGSDSYFNGHALSDGTLRFICLSTLLLQPEPPAMIIIDEPELGLHPFAITQLVSMIRSLMSEHQVLISTQSVTLLNQLELGDIIVTEQRGNATTFERPDLEQLQDWLQEFAVGDLWEKNVFGGRPS